VLPQPSRVSKTEALTTVAAIRVKSIAVNFIVKMVLDIVVCLRLLIVQEGWVFRRMSF
jgi:hypothetical protein